MREKSIRQRRFRFIEHTADIGLTACGENLAGAFANAAYGLFSIITDLRYVKKKESKTVEVNGENGDALLYEWLNDLLYIFDTELLLLKRFDISEFNERHLKAECFGEKYDPGRHHLRRGVKAATYHMLTVDKEKSRVQVILDI